MAMQVDPLQIADAARGIRDAEGVLRDGLRTCVDRLNALGAPWGDSELGRSFFNGEDGQVGFRAARDGTLNDLTRLALALRGHAVGAVRMAQAYQVAETGDDPEFGWNPLAPSTTTTVHLAAQDTPPPAIVMQVLDLAEELVAMCVWPRNADAGRMDGIGTAFDDLADVVDRVTGIATKHARNITDHNDGAAIEAFGRSFARLAQNGRGDLVDAAQACRALAGYGHLFATEIRSVKTQCVSAGMFLVGLWVVARVMAATPYGVPYQLAALAETRSVGMSLARLLADTRIRAAIAGAAYVGGLDLVGQTVRDHYGLQDGIDGGRLATTTALAFATGGAMGMVHRFLGNLHGNELATFLSSTVPGRIATNTALGAAVNIGTDIAFNEGHADLGKDILMGAGMAVSGEVAGAFGKKAGRTHAGPPLEPPGREPEGTGLQDAERLTPDIVRSADLLLETTPEGLRLHEPIRDINGEAARIVAIEAVPTGKRIQLHYRRLYYRSDPNFYGKRFADLQTGTRGGNDGGLHDRTASVRLDALERRGVPLERQLQDTGFQNLADGVLRYRHGDKALTAVLREGRADFYGPVDGNITEMARTSRVIGHDLEPADGWHDHERTSVRLSNGWLEYSLVSGDPRVLHAEAVAPVTPVDVGVAAATPRVDGGFVIGGPNSTETILGLTHINGRPIAELEAWMRPFDFDHPTGPKDYSRSEQGFLGPRDGLLATMARDNEVVRRLGLTHEEIGEHVLMARDLAFSYGLREYIGGNGERQGIRTDASMGTQTSPFKDGLNGGQDFTVTNLQTGASAHLSALGGGLIQRYGFYQGTGTTYRAAPEDIIRAFSVLLEKAGGEERVREVLK
jgi:hypothetical protein